MRGASPARRSKLKRRRPPRLPVPMMCVVFLQTELGVIVERVIGDRLHEPFRKRRPDCWVSWRALTPAEVQRWFR
jgi:hypothetical protein